MTRRLSTLKQQTAELKAAIRAANAPTTGAPATPANSPVDLIRLVDPPTSATTAAAVTAAAAATAVAAAARSAVLSTSSTKLVVTVDLGASVQSEADDR